MATPDFSQLGGATEAERRSFWSRPEGLTGVIFLAILAGVGLVAYDKVVTFLLGVIRNTLYLGLLLGVLGVVAFLLTNKDIRTGMFFLFKTLMRKFTGLVIQLDPIAILKIYIEDLRKKHAQMQGQINTLAGQLVKLKTKISENNESIQQKFAEANKAKSMADRPGMENAARLATLEGAGLQQMNEQLLPLRQKMEQVLAFMEKVNSSADFIIKETEIKVRLKETEYNMVKASSNALRTALSIFKGDPDKKFMFDASLEHIQDDMSQKLGEMQRAMELSLTFINSVDVQNGILTDKGAAMLDAYNRGDIKLVGLDTPAAAPAVALPATPPAAAPASGHQGLLD